MSRIRIEGVCKSFGENHVLADINTEIEDGQFVTLLGPSGCGKTTLLRIIAGFEKADKGKIYIDDLDISSVSVNKRDIGMVFQSYALFPNMTVYDNVAFGLRTRKVDEKEIKTRVQEMLKMVGLEEKINFYPNELSGGQQQRVALTRALVTNPKVLLLDEPLSALDAKIRESLRKLIKDIQKKLKITTVFVTHDQEEALSISDKVCVMNKGLIVQEGIPSDIYKSPNSQFVAQFIGTYNFFKPEKIDKNKVFIPFPVNIDTCNKLDENTLLGVRPEAIQVLESINGNESENIFQGKINDISILGNVVRFGINVQGKNIIADELYNEIFKNFKVEEIVYIKISDKSFLVLNE